MSNVLKGRLKYFIYISIIFVFILECLENIHFIGAYYLKLLKYLVSAVTFVLCTIQILGLKKDRLNFWKECKGNITVCVIFLAISLICIFRTREMTDKTLIELIQLFIPFGYAFIVINWLNFSEIKNFMRVCLFAAIAGYVVSKGLNVFIWENILDMSIISGSSVFESSSFAEISSGLAAFFIYYRKKMPICAVLSCLFCFFTFKRVFVLQMVCLLLVSFLHWEDKRISRGFVIFSMVCVITATLLYYYLMQKENADLFYQLFGTTAGSFSMGRTYRIWHPLRDFVSFGFGSTSEVLGYNLEMDLVKIFMELGIIGLCTFVYNYINLCKGNFYLLVLMILQCVNLLFASGLTSSFGWVMRIIAAACILYSERIWKDSQKGKKRIRFVIRRSKTI